MNQYIKIALKELYKFAANSENPSNDNKGKICITGRSRRNSKGNQI